MDRLISIGKTAELLGTTIRNLRRWDEEVKLNAVRTQGGHRRYRLSDIQRLQGIDPDQPREQDTLSVDLSKFWRTVHAISIEREWEHTLVELEKTQKKLEETQKELERTKQKLNETQKELEDERKKSG